MALTDNLVSYYKLDESSTTVLSKTMYLGFVYNTEATTVTKWDLIALANEAYLCQ